MLTLRTASVADIPLLRHWDSLPHVIAASPNDDWDWADVFADPDPAMELLVAELDANPIGLVQIIDPHLERSQYWGSMAPHQRAIDIWIGPVDALGKGYGTQMMQLAHKQCFADAAVTGIWIDPLVSNTDAIRFYQRLGYEPIGERWFDQDLCLVHHLTRNRWETMMATYQPFGM